jgi:hypothetical protein
MEYSSYNNGRNSDITGSKKKNIELVRFEMIMVSTDMWFCVVSYKFNAVLKENLLPLSWYLIMMEAASPMKCQCTSVRLQSHISQHSSLQYNISGQNEV